MESEDSILWVSLKGEVERSDGSANEIIFLNSDAKRKEGMADKARRTNQELEAKMVRFG